MLTQIIPLEKNTDGVILVSNTRVRLDTIVGAFKDGATAEHIAESYPTVPLPDVYCVIAYYLTHLKEVEDYLAERKEFAARVRAENEKRFDTTSLRARLLARRAQAI